MMEEKYKKILENFGFSENDGHFYREYDNITGNIIINNQKMVQKTRCNLDVDLYMSKIMPDDVETIFVEMISKNIENDSTIFEDTRNYYENDENEFSNFLMHILKNNWR